MSDKAMTLAEATEQVEQMIATTRAILKPGTTDREVYDVVFGAIQTPRNVSEQVAEDYGMLRLALTDVTGDAYYRSHTWKEGR
jgi:hypothetical protein